MPRQLSVFEAIEHQLQLLGVVCSSIWVESLVAPRADGTWWFHDDLYPPGGDETTMQECPECHRIGPPHCERVCLDCDVAQADEEFLKRLARVDRSFAFELLRRWWRPGVTYEEFVGQPAEVGGCPAAECRRESKALDDDRPWRLRRSGKRHEPLQGSHLDGRLKLDLALDRLRGGKKGTTRASGCQLTLLPESEDKLRREIAYFKKHGRLLPSRKRYTRPNPFERAPEDRDLSFTHHAPCKVFLPDRKRSLRWG